jgi:phosphoribosylaminoimidazole-succinocarboxamide synthase
MENGMSTATDMATLKALATPANNASVLSPQMVTKAKRAKQLSDLVKQAKKELDQMASDFDAFLSTHKVEVATDAAGTVLVRRTRGKQRRLDQKAIREAHPEIVEAFMSDTTWESVAYGA